MKKDRLVGIILGAVSIGFLIMTSMLPKSRYSTAIGADVFPNLASGGLLLCAIGLVIQSYRRTEHKRTKPFLDREGWIRVLKLAILLALFPLVFSYLGFIIASLMLLIFMIRMFDLNKSVPLWKVSLISAAITAILYFSFLYLLKIQLPMGVAFEKLVG